MSPLFKSLGLIWDLLLIALIVISKVLGPSLIFLIIYTINIFENTIWTSAS